MFLRLPHRNAAHFNPSTVFVKRDRDTVALVAIACLASFLVGGIGRLALGPASPRGTIGDALDRRALDPLTAGWMGVLSAIGAGKIASPAIGICLILWLRHWKRAALCFLVTVLSGWALNGLLKWGFQRHRPEVIDRMAGAGWYSYPSGHAMLAPLVFGLGLILLTRRSPSPARRALGYTIAVLLPIGIAYSRVYLGVHYPSDVIGALLAGTGWAALGVAVYGPLEPHPPSPPVVPPTPPAIPPSGPFDEGAVASRAA
jgi:membrane-associated phospholipid phosphatase